MKLKELFYQSKSIKVKLGSPYLIAEAGVNHGGNLNTAFQLIDEAVEGGQVAARDGRAGPGAGVVEVGEDGDRFPTTVKAGAPMPLKVAVLDEGKGDAPPLKVKVALVPPGGPLPLPATPAAKTRCVSDADCGTSIDTRVT